jgi:N6-adenosine-specific RNA methylase IME4
MSRYRERAMIHSLAESLQRVAHGRKFRTILADPPWQFQNRTGKMAPEHRRLARYGTMSMEELLSLPVADVSDTTAHLYLWVPNALLPEGLELMAAWGFAYKTNIVWHKIRKDGGPDGRGVGFYFRNTTELVLFGVRGKNARTLAPGRRQVNILKTQKREHSRKPDELYSIIESCSPGPYLELFARGARKKWSVWGDQAEDYAPSWPTYSNHSASEKSTGSRAGSVVVPIAAQAGIAAQSLLLSSITMKQTVNNALDPNGFIEACVENVAGSKLTASQARDAYRDQCKQLRCNPVHDLTFWRALSAAAENLGVGKGHANGHVVYLDLALKSVGLVAAE